MTVLAAILGALQEERVVYSTNFANDKGWPIRSAPLPSLVWAAVVCFAP